MAVGLRLGQPGHTDHGGVTGGIALAKVRYDRYVRFVVPLMGVVFVLICAFLAMGAWV